MVVYRLFVNIKFRAKMNKLEAVIIMGLVSAGTIAWAESMNPDFFVPEGLFERPKANYTPVYRERPIRVGSKGANSSSGIKNAPLKKPRVQHQQPQVKKLDHNIIGEPGFNNILTTKNDDSSVSIEISGADRNTKQNTKTETKKIQKTIKINPPEKKVYSPEDGLGDGLVKEKDYQDKLTTYENDLLAISESGKAPDNPQLKSDLDAMNTNLSFSVQ